MREGGGIRGTDDAGIRAQRAAVARAPDELEMALKDVMPGARLLTELRMANGTLLVPPNFEVTKTLLDRIANLYPELLLKPVRVAASKA